MYAMLLFIGFLSCMVNAGPPNLDEDYIDTTVKPTFDESSEEDEDPTKDLVKCTIPDGRSGFCVSPKFCSSQDNVIYNTTLIPRSGICSSPNNEELWCCSYESPSGCGLHHSAGSRFGTQVSGLEFPWSVALYSQNLHLDLQSTEGYFCGGTLIHPSVVLSATSCFHNRKPEDILALVRSWDLSSKSNMKNFFPVSEIARHEKYIDGTRVNNIALLFLSMEVTLDSNIRTICLPESNAFEPNDVECLATGWGPDSFYHYPNIMQVLETKLEERDSCQHASRKWFRNPRWKLDEKIMCAKSIKDNCAADQGSPLICHVKGNKAVYMQYGILSIGTQCGKIPAQYTKTSSMRQWIDRKMLEKNYLTGNYAYKPYV